ncbi:MAG TPA: hypothetical protein VF226_21560 [Hyphomicrobiaceae bacterium]|jgi:hypothetical protein
MSSVGVFVDRVIDHLEQVIQEETSLLKSRQAVDLYEFNNRKSQGLYNLGRALLMLEGRKLESSTLAKLESLRRALTANEAAISVHLHAVREITDVISKAVRESESDGTYEAPDPLRGKV